MAPNFLTKLKKAGKRKSDEVVFEGSTFTLRDMSGEMRDFYDADIKSRVKFKGRHPDLNTLDTKNQRAIVVAMCLVDDDTDKLAFDYTNAEDLKQLGELSGALLDFLFEKSMEICGLMPKAAEDAEKN
jgi:hypothetical protein